MDITVLRNFRRYLLPLAGTEPLTCLQLGLRSPAHAVWLMTNVLACCDDYWWGTDDFRGSAVLHGMALTALGPFTNATLWGIAPAEFCRNMPPPAAAGLKRPLSLCYIDVEPGEALAELLEFWRGASQPGSVLVVNQYRTRQQRVAEAQALVDSFLRTVPHEAIWDNAQIGVRRTDGRI